MHYHELKPRDLVRERLRCPVAYLPLGNLEWHGFHNPVGLDGLKAEAVLDYLASHLGGLVMPALYWGDHRAEVVEVIYDPAVSSFPPPDAYDHATLIAQEMKLTRTQFEADGARSTANGGWRLWEELVVHVLFQIETLGFKLIVSYPGHGPMFGPLDRAVATYHAMGGAARVFVLMDHLVAYGDHAARFETSLLIRLRPELVDLNHLSPGDEVHLGVLGESPLQATAGHGQEMLAQFLKIVNEQMRLSAIATMPDPDPLHAYYSARAPYMAKSLGIEPSGQLLEIITELKAQADDRNVLEIACGTGYWTRFVGPVSRGTTATDFSGEMLGVARDQPIAHTRFLHQDAYSPTVIGDLRFDFGFAMHWLSHVPFARWPEFFAAFHARLKPGAKVLLADDIRRPDDADPHYSKLGARDTYEIRRLPNGEAYEIVKNYFTPDELRALLEPYAENLQIRYERPRWWLTYEVRDAKSE